MTSPSAVPAGLARSIAPYRRSIHRVFDGRVSEHPDAVAIECGERRWTDADIDAEIAAASRSIAAELREAGVFFPGDPRERGRA